MATARMSIAIAASVLLATLLAGVPAQAGSGCTAGASGPVASCTLRLAGTHLLISGSVGYPTTQPLATVVVKLVSETTGLELLRCEWTEPNSTYAGCNEQVANSLVRAGLPPTETLSCIASGSPEVVSAGVQCMSWAGVALLG